MDEYLKSTENDIQDINGIEEVVSGVINTISSNALGKLGVQDQAIVSMDVDICSNKFRKWKSTSERELEPLQPIQTFLMDMEIMIKKLKRPT